MRLGAWRGDRPLHTLHHTLVSGAEKSPRFHRGRCFRRHANVGARWALKNRTKTQNALDGAQKIRHV